jgi:hypothetical protein
MELNRKLSFLLFLCLNSFNFLFSQQVDLVLKNKDSVFISKKDISNIEVVKTLDSIKNIYLLKGFFDVSFIKKKENDILFVDLITGVKVSQIYLNKPSNKFQNDIYQKLSLKINKDGFYFLSVNDYPELVDSIMKIYASSGFPFVTVKADKIRMNGKDKILLDLIIDTQRKRRIDKLVVQGCENFPSKFLKYYLKSNKNEVYSDKSLIDLDVYFRSLFFVDKIKNPEVLFKKDSTIIYLYLKKKKVNSFDGLLGFENESQTSKFRFNGYVKLNLKNIFDKGNSFRLNWESNGKAASSLDLSYKTSYLYGTSFSNFTQFSILKRDSTYINLQLNNEFSFLLKRGHMVFTSYNFENSNLTSNQVLESKNSFFKHLIGVGYSFDKRMNSIYEPWMFRIKTSFNLGIKKEEGRGLEKQQILEFLASYNTGIISNLLFKNTLQYKELFSKTTLSNELFAIGGFENLRGFKTKSVLVDKYIILNSDVQWYFNKKNKVVLLADYGLLHNVSNNYSAISIGIGYGFSVSANGYVNLNYIITKQKNQSFNNGILGINLISYF